MGDIPPGFNLFARLEVTFVTRSNLSRFGDDADPAPWRRDLELRGQGGEESLLELSSWSAISREGPVQSPPLE